MDLYIYQCLFNNIYNANIFYYHNNWYKIFKNDNYGLKTDFNL
jgi:hypothetical protein